MEMKTGRLERTKQIVRKLAKAVAGAVLVSGLMLAPKLAHADSIELMAGHNQTTIDLKASAEITKKLGVFMRARPSVDYDGNISSFGLVDLTINLTDGLDAVGEVQFVGGKVVPRAGVQHFIKTGDFSAYNLATLGMDSESYLELLTALKYCPALSQTLKLLAHVENVTDLDKTGHVWSTQRIRLGVLIDGWGFGPAVDLTETGNSPKTSDGTLGWNLGGFVSKTF
ncbi:MAG: hypothetical protein ABID61_00880 [Candidatus Micrarchaeota archaeon]